MLLFRTTQNNTGGTYKGPKVILIKASDYKEANNIFLSHPDVYLNGPDCACCGNRWEEFTRYDDALDYPVSFIEVDDIEWEKAVFMDGFNKFKDCWYKYL